jgi:hypothetical protein
MQSVCGVGRPAHLALHQSAGPTQSSRTLCGYLFQHSLPPSSPQAVCMRTNHFGDFACDVGALPLSLPPGPPHVQEAARRAHGVEGMWWTAVSQSARGGLFRAMG